MPPPPQPRSVPVNRASALPYGSPPPCNQRDVSITPGTGWPIGQMTHLGQCELRRILLLRTRVNKGKEEGPRRYTPALTGDGEASLLPRRRTEDLRSIPGADGSQPLHLGFVGRLLWLGRHGQ